MKTFVLLLGLALVTSLPAFAQEAKKAKGGASVEQRIEALKTELALTPEQVEKIKPILEEEKAKMQELMADKSADKTAQQAKRRELMKETTAKLNAIYTPEQQEKAKAAKKGGKKE